MKRFSRDEIERFLRSLDENLDVAAPHDLAASKLLRGNQHDRDQLRELHELHPLSLEELVTRYVALLADYVGDPTESRWSLVHFVEEVWGELDGIKARRAVGL